MERYSSSTCSWKIPSLRPSLPLLQHSQSQYHNLPWRPSGQTPTCPAPFFICHPRLQVIPPHSCSRYDSEHPFSASISPCSTSKSLWLLELMSISSKILHIRNSFDALLHLLVLAQKEALLSPTRSPPEISSLCPLSAYPNQKPQGKGAHWCRPCRRSLPLILLPCPCTKQSRQEWAGESVQHNGKDGARGREAKVCQRARKLSQAFIIQSTIFICSP